MPGLMDFLAAGLTGAATKDPLAYRRMLDAERSRGLDDLFRKYQMDRMAKQDELAEEERTRLNRPASTLFSPEMAAPPPRAIPSEAPGMGREFPQMRQNPIALRDLMTGQSSTIPGVPSMGMGERPPMTDIVPGVPAPTGRVDYGKPRQDLTLRDLPAVAQAMKMMAGEQPEYKGAAWGTFDPRTGKPVFQRPGAETGAKGASWGTYDPKTGKPIYERPEKPLSTKSLQSIQEDIGDKVRYGTFNPETGEKKWGEWQKKGGLGTGEGGQKPLGLKDYEAIDARNRDDARQNAVVIAAKQGYGRIVQKPDGSLDMQWLTEDAPQKFQQEMDNQYRKLAQEAQRRGLLPKDWIQEATTPGSAVPKRNPGESVEQYMKRTGQQ